LKEVTSTLLSNENRKRPNQVEQEGSGLVVMGKKGREKEKAMFVEAIVIFVNMKVIRRRNTSIGKSD